MILLLHTGTFKKFSSIKAGRWPAEWREPTGRGLRRQPELTLCLPVAGDRLSEKETEDLMAWMRNALGSRVTDVKVTVRLDTHPAMITVLEMGAARHFLRMRQLAKTQEERAQLLQPTLEINPRHVLIKKLSQLRDSEPDLAQLLVDQIYENAMITAGLVDDPRPMVGRLNQLLVKALERH